MPWNSIPYDYYKSKTNKTIIITINKEKKRKEEEERYEKIKITNSEKAGRSTRVTENFSKLLLRSAPMSLCSVAG